MTPLNVVPTASDFVPDDKVAELKGFVRDFDRFVRSLPVVTQEQIDVLCCGECDGCEFFSSGQFYPEDITHVGMPSPDPKNLTIIPLEYRSIKGSVCILEFLRDARPQLISDVATLIKEEAAVQEALAQ